MIYIYNKENSKITTDSWVEFIPLKVQVYLDDIYIGTYLNESNKNEYIVLTILGVDLINIENKEYKLSLINNDNAKLIKIELVVVKKVEMNSTDSSLINNKKDIFYE